MAPPNPTVAENARNGTEGWKITNSEEARASNQIKATVTPFSVAPGETAEVRVSTQHSTYAVEVFRMGWYNGTGGRLVARLGTYAGEDQGLADRYLRDNSSDLRWATWNVSFRFTVAPDWFTGVYLLKLVTSAGAENHAPFVVRSGGPPLPPSFTPANSPGRPTTPSGVPACTRATQRAGTGPTR